MLKGKGYVGGMKGVQSLPLCTSIEKPNFREGLWLSEADANNAAHCIPRPCGLGAADVTDSSLQTASLPCQGGQVSPCLPASGFCIIGCNPEAQGTDTLACWEHVATGPPLSGRQVPHAKGPRGLTMCPQWPTDNLLVPASHGQLSLLPIRSLLTPSHPLADKPPAAKSLGPTLLSGGNPKQDPI